MKIALTGGGTLGHVIPALSVKAALAELDGECEFFFIGSKKENERRRVEADDICFYPISSGKLRRYFSIENLTDIFRLLKGYFEARTILKREKPDIVFSKGGYVSVPVVAAAHSLGIKCVTHESDRSLGLANRINARFCEKVCLGFENKELEGAKYIYTGNPVRRDLVSSEPCEREDLILVLGGSQGAKEINELIYDNLDYLLSLGSVYHQAGVTGDFSIKRDGYSEVKFISSELPSLLRRAKVVLSRAGAGAISELLYASCVTIYIPLGLGASRGDQILNAEYLESEGAALVLKDKKAFMEVVNRAFRDQSLREELIKNSERLAVRDAAIKIARVILELMSEA